MVKIIIKIIIVLTPATNIEDKLITQGNKKVISKSKIINKIPTK